LKKRKAIKIASIAIGVVLVGMFLFAMPLLGVGKSSEVQSTSAPAVTAEETSVNTDKVEVQSTSAPVVTTEEATVANDTDDVQEEVVDKNETTDVEGANESGDIKEADENLPGGGHEDQDSAEGEIDHQFEGVE
jgi:hypothetical protein